MSNNRFPSLGDRMKEYEFIPQIKLTKRMPVIIRLDGKGFHNYTKNMQKPFDMDLQMTMWRSTAKLCKEVQNTVFAYCQSDEISLLLIDYNTLNTQPWFGNEVQKLCSISASKMTQYFNDPLTRGKLPYGASFDARCFNIPREEVVNYFIWRQQDWIRNSVQMVAQYYFSTKELYKKNVSEMKQMLIKKNYINWDTELQPFQQKGVSILKNEYYVQLYPNHKRLTGSTGRIVDCNVPIFKDKREYIENLLYNDKNILDNSKSIL